MPSLIIVTGSRASCGVTQLVVTLGASALPPTVMVSISCQSPGWIPLAAKTGGAHCKIRNPAPTKDNLSSMMPHSHPKHPEPRPPHRRIERGGKRQRQHAAGFGRRNDAVVPQPRGGEIRIALALELLAQRRLERLLLVGAPAFALAFDIVALDGGEHRGRLLAAHHRDARVRPGEQKTRRVSAPAHA